MKIGIIGAGSIGRFLFEKLNVEKLFPSHEIVSVFDDRQKSQVKLKELSTTYGFNVFQDLDLFLASDIDVVVECANIQVVNNYATQIIKEKDLLLISVGALADPSLYQELTSIAKLHEHKVYLPSGAIGGLDLLMAAKVMDGLDSVTLVSRKPVGSLTNESLEEATLLFEGSAEDAIQRYPQNANVAITLSLAGIGVRKTNVKIIADPTIEINIHTIYAEGDFGKFELTTENNPLPSNAKTSYITSLSILSALLKLDEQIVVS